MENEKNASGSVAHGGRGGAPAMLELLLAAVSGCAPTKDKPGL
ncbi:MAG: hypothetical protein WC717_01380 [Candidatus Micrarchaeia archaeon]